jgi:hypothetical protein
MSMIKLIDSGSQSFAEPIVQLVKISSRGLIGADRGILEKRASTALFEQLLHIKTAADEPLVHLLAMGATEGVGPNRNGDGFLAAMLRRCHPTFVKHARFYRDHQNKDPSKSYGIVKASAYNEAMRRVELLVALNGSKEAARRNGGLVADKELEKLAKNEELPVSMAIRVPFDQCSWCYNKAATRAEYCNHIDHGGHCKAGGLKHHIGELVEMEKDGQSVLHHLHADNPDGTFFDISHVFRPADRIAYVTGLLKAASASCISGAELAERLGVTMPYDLCIEARHPAIVRRMLKAAHQLVDMEQQDVDMAFAASVHSEAALPTLPPLFQEKFASVLRALTDVRICWPLEQFLSAMLGGNSEKIAGAIRPHLPGIYSRLIARPDFVERVEHNPYLPANATNAQFRLWAQKQAEDYAWTEAGLQQRSIRAALRNEPAPLRSPDLVKLAQPRDAAERLAEEYALYTLAYAASVPESEFILTAKAAMLHNRTS